MSVAIVDAWAQQDDFETNGLTYAPGGIAGTNRMVVMVVGAEEDGSTQAGPMSVASATLGGRAMTVDVNLQAGTDAGYHNTLTVLLLDDADIELMSGSTLLITWTNFDGSGPFPTSPVVHYATYRDVDQTTPNGASQSNTSDANVNTLAPTATMNVAIDEKVIAINVGGQPFTPSSSVGGLTEETEYVGGGNDMTLAVYHRTAVTADASYTFTMDLSDVTRMAVYAIALAFDEIILTSEQDSFHFYDDGTESGAASLENQDVDLTIAKEEIFHLRQGTQYVGDPAACAVTLEYKKTGDPDAEYRKLL